MTLYYRGLAKTPASVATPAYPIWALILGLRLGKSHLDAGQWAGVAFLLVSLQLIQSTHAVAPQKLQVIES